MPAEPSPEVKAVLKEFCEVQRAKYGPDWKKILAAEMTKASMPYINAILRLQK